MKLEKFITNFIKLASPVILLFSWLGFIVGGIWLLMMGQWGFVIFGFISSLLIQYVIAIPLLIVGGISAGIVLLLNKLKSKKVTTFGIFLTSLFQHLIYVAWVFLGFAWVLNASTDHNVIPFIIFGYSLVTGPFASMARGEPADNYGTFVAVFLIEASYIILAFSFLIGLSIIALPLILVMVFLFDLLIAKTVSGDIINI